MNQTRYKSEPMYLGEVVAHCYGNSVRAWLKAHRGARSSEVFITSHLERVIVQLDRCDHRNQLTVIATVIGRQATPSETDFYRFRRTAESVWREVDSHHM
jgi:hypothetical protein